jgi:hypothetical protein
MTLPHLAGVLPAIAGEKLITVGSFDHAEWRVRPGEAGTSVGERGLCFLSGIVSLCRRDDDSVGRNLGCTELAGGLSLIIPLPKREGSENSDDCRSIACRGNDLRNKGLIPDSCHLSRTFDSVC